MNSPRTLVGLDGYFLSQPTSGSGQYTVHLWRRLASGDNHPEVVLLHPASLMNVESNGGRREAIQSPRLFRSVKAQKLWWEQAGVMSAMRQSGAALLHVPYMSAPRAARFPLIVTIHDLIPMVLPDYGGSPPMRIYLRLVLPATRRARLILTDSECSKQDIVRLLRVDDGLVRVIPLAVDQSYRPQTDPDAERALRSRYGLEGPIIFNVGGLDTRKNVSMLIEAFARALPNLDPTTRLVIGGQAHTGNEKLYPPLEPVVRRWGLEGRVKLTGRISDDEKRLFYQIADLYVFPSLYEGFGLTPLEAMACGLPVVAANRSSLPEVVGTGGLLIDPTPARFAAAMESILNDEHLHRELSQRALDQAARFSWEHTAAETRAAYLEALDLVHS
jgi:glycosyltransferase involved in cell wall biosynthesis